MSVLHRRAALLAGVVATIAMSSAPSGSERRPATQEPASDRYVVRLDETLSRATIEATFPSGTRHLRMDAGQAQHLPRDWATFVTIESAIAGGRRLTVTPDDHAGWILQTAAAPVTVSYSVDLSFARQSWPAGNEQAARAFSDALYIVGRCLFAISDTAGPRRVQFVLPQGWSVTTPWTREPATALEYMTIDAADLTRNGLVIGRHRSIPVSAGPLEVELALPGGNETTASLTEPVLRALLPAYIRLFPGTPRTRYVMTFFQADAEDGEAFTRSAAFTSASAPARDTTLVWANFLAHELFHFWNGQRLRGADPRSSWRWFAEGVSEFYANTTLARHRVISREQFVKKAERHLGNYLYFMTSPAMPRLSLVAAGANTTAHRFAVYDGGWTAAFCVDGLIREASSGRRSLDDVMTKLWTEFGVAGKPYTLADIQRHVEAEGGAAAAGFFETYVNQPNVMPVQACAARAGFSAATKGYAAEAFLHDANADADDMRAVGDVIDRYRRAIIDGRRDAAGAVLDDSFVITSGDGSQRDKQGELNDLFPAGLTVHAFEIDSLAIRVVDRSAIATGILRWTMTYQGRKSDVARRTTIVLAKVDGTWRITGQHVSRM